MRRKEKRTTTTEGEVVVEIRCDLCGQAGNHLRSHAPWAAGSYDVNETEVKMRTGHSYPEGGSGEEVKYDICPTCFTEKLMPWLASQGANPTRTDWDW